MEIDQIIALNRKESYMSENHCAVCYSPATCRCGKCGVVPYCSGRCQIDHWEQGHRRECPLLEDMKEVNGNTSTEFLMILQRKEEYMAENCCAYCDSSPKANFPSWSELYIFHSEGCEMDYRIHYLDEQCQPFQDAGNSEVVHYCSEHRQTSEWIPKQRQEPQQVYDSGEITEEVASGLKHFERADHAARQYVYSVFERGSSSSMNASDSDGSDSVGSIFERGSSSSMNASDSDGSESVDSFFDSCPRNSIDSDAISSLHGFD